MSSALPSGIVAVGALFAQACFHPDYRGKRCGPNGACPSEWSCNPQGICEEDRGGLCDPTGMFAPPMPLPGVNTGGAGGVSRLTADELELYVEGNLDTEDTNIYKAQRSTTSQPFGVPTPLPRVNTAANEFDPSVSSDGLMLFFQSSRVSGEGGHLYVSTRTSRVGEFGAPSEVANVNSAKVTDEDAQPFVTADGQELWFTSDRAGGLGKLDIYRATWNGSSFANVAAITALSTNAADEVPVLSADKLTVYFSSDRDGKAGLDIWTAHRSTTHDGFPAPTLVPELNSSAADYVGWLSPDNCRIYFASDRTGTFDTYVATRHPL